MKLFKKVHCKAYLKKIKDGVYIQFSIPMVLIIMIDLFMIMILKQSHIEPNLTKKV